VETINPLNAELNPIRHLLALEGAHHIVHVSRVRGKVYKESGDKAVLVLNLGCGLAEWSAVNRCSNTPEGRDTVH
jgi:hypothetical protein